MELGYTFRLAQPSDIDQLGTVGPAIYAESYNHMWSDPEAYARHLESFGAPAVADFMERSNTETWVVECRARIVGFLSVVIGAPDPVEGRTDGAEVPRIYILAPARGRGLAAKLISQADDYVRDTGANHLWLDAMKEAPWAWRTYRKWGFLKIGETEFPEEIRPEFKPMVVMRRQCEQTSAKVKITRESG